MVERDTEGEAPQGEGAERVVAVLDLPARLAAENFTEFYRVLADRLATPGARVVLDLSAVEEIADNAWLGYLVRGQGIARATGGDLRLATAQPRVLAILGRTGLLDVFDVYPTPERAVASFDA